MRCSHHRRVYLAFWGRSDHHKAFDPRHLRRNSVHQHGRWIGRAAAGYIDTSCINRAPSRAQTDTFLVAIITVLGQLRFVIGLYALCREFKGISQFWSKRLIGSLAFLRRNLPALLAQTETGVSHSQGANEVNAVGGGRVQFTARAHIADRLLNDCRNIGFGFTPAANQFLELAFEIWLVGRKPKH